MDQTAKQILIVGAGQGGTHLLRTFHTLPNFEVIAITDIRPEAPGFALAKYWGIPTGDDYLLWLQTTFVDIIFEATGQEEVYRHLEQVKPEGTLLVPGSIANLLMSLIAMKEQLIGRLKRQETELQAMINSTHDAMIAVDEQGRISLFNRSAERLIQLKAEDVLNQPVSQVVPNSRLDIVLHTGIPELNQEQQLTDDARIVTNRVPILTDDGKIIGAVAVFRDISDILELAEEITDLKEIQSLLKAIIHSTEDAISIVDEQGLGMMINPAYTRLTGMKEEDVLGKPADVDISEGQSMHMQVLKTKHPVRGVRMKVGPYGKEVVVNVAPIMVGDQLRGSVGIIHDMTEMKQLTDELAHAKQMLRTLQAKYTFQDMIAESEGMKLAVEQALNVASTPATVLLRGESGTGKELFAHAIHHASPRRNQQFVRVNCAAIAENLLESELFGYEEGAFTGAKKGGKKGYFEEAHSGTIFLDEIGELPMGVQVKLLRILQEKEIIRVGGTEPIPIDVRVIAATHANLEKMIQEQRFREDLYYRLNVIPIMIPPLRLRKQEFPMLIQHILRKLNLEYRRMVQEIDPDALQFLLDYDWPGNVRELENILGRAMISMHVQERMIQLHHLPPLGHTPKVISNSVGVEELEPLHCHLEQMERNYIRQALQACDGNKTKAAALLQISVRNLYYKIQRYGL